MTDKVEIEATLTQANKILINLKGAHKQHTVLKKKKMHGYSTKSTVSGPNPIVTTEWTSKNPVTKEQFVALSDRMIQNNRSKIATHLMLNIDVRSVKDIIFETNIKCGVSATMSSLQLCAEELEIFESMLKVQRDIKESDITQDVNQAYDHGVEQVKKEVSTVTSFSVTRLVHPTTFLTEKVQNLKREIRELEAKRDQLNTTTKVTLLLHKDTAAMLGL